MTQTHFSITVDIPAPPPIVWSVMSDVERWPEWTASIARVKRLSPGPLQVGSRFRVHQPKLPPAFWRVTELNSGSDFTWLSVAPGLRVTARHAVEPAAVGSRATLSIRYEGWFSAPLARWVGRLNDQYLALEAAGLKRRAVEFSASVQAGLPHST
jgi:uncharacterized membrane protein